MEHFQTIVLNFVIAAALGGLLGVQRGIRRHTDPNRENYQNFGGLRTYTLIAVLGALSGYMYAALGDVLVLLVPFSLLCILIVVSYREGLKDGNSRDLISELVALITFTLGAMCLLVPIIVPIIVGIAITGLLSLKHAIRSALSYVTEELFMDALKFAIVAFVILPLIPNQTIDPWGIINPFSVWLFVVIVSAISFSGYVISRLVGPGKSILLTGLIGGLASSTATTMHLSTLSKKAKGGTVLFVSGIILATLVMFIRLQLIIFIVSPQLAMRVFLCFILMFATCFLLLFALREYKKRTGNGHPHELAEEMQVKSAFRLAPALKFGLIFMGIQILEFLSTYYFGDSGLYLFSFITGLADTESPTYIIASGFLNGTHMVGVATTALILVVAANSVSKSIIPLFLGRRDVGIYVFTILMASAVVGILGAVYLV